MPVATNIYRRGAVYWWRRSTCWVSGEPRPTLALSLGTKDAGVARIRAAALTLWSETVQVEKIFIPEQTALTAEQRNALWANEVRRYRDQLISDPHEALRFGAGATGTDPLAQLERGWARLIKLPKDRLARADEVEAVLKGEDDEFTRVISETVSRLQYPAHLAAMGNKWLAEVGAPTNKITTKIAASVVVGARATAARDHRLGKLMPIPIPNPISVAASSIGSRSPVVADGGVSSTSFATIGPPVLKGENGGAGTPPTAQTPAAVAVASPENSATPAQAVSSSLDYRTMKPSDVAKAHLVWRKGDLTHRSGGKREKQEVDEHTERQVLWAATLLEKSMNDHPTTHIKPFAELIQKDLVQLDKDFEGLPTSVGKSSLDREPRITLPMIIGRADLRVKKGELRESQIGLDVETTNKHFRKLSILWDWLQKRVPELHNLDFDAFINPSGRDERDERDAYTVEQAIELFTLPPWTGCASSAKRFVKGLKRFADALVWVMLLVWYTGVRREEICKLLVAEVHEQSGIHYFEVQNSEGGRIKNSRSRRYIVICDELIRLGFVAYVEAIRGAGHVFLFPELLTESGKSKKGDVFYRIWWSKIAPRLPFLKPGQAMHSARHSFDTELKELGVAPELRADAAGRKSGAGGETDRYGKALRLKKLQELFNRVPIVTAHLPAFTPIRLLPVEQRRPRPARRTKKDSPIKRSTE